MGNSITGVTFDSSGYMAIDTTVPPLDIGGVVLDGERYPFRDMGAASSLDRARLTWLYRHITEFEAASDEPTAAAATEYDYNLTRAICIILPTLAISRIESLSADQRSAALDHFYQRRLAQRAAYAQDLMGGGEDA